MKDITDRIGQIQKDVNEYRGKRAATSWTFVSAARRGGWGILDFENGWTDTNLQPVMFRMSGDGNVEIRGKLTDGVVGTVAFTLPPGYWPPKTRRWACANGTTGYAIVRVDPDGAVTVEFTVS